MEYGDAITPRGLERALALAHEELRLHPDRPLEKVAADAVRQAYCACVIVGEDPAEGRFSDMHRMLAQQVASRLRSIRAIISARLPALAIRETER